jgi:hypothetical protein
MRHLPEALRLQSNCQTRFLSKLQHSLSSQLSLHNPHTPFLVLLVFSRFFLLSEDLHSLQPFVSYSFDPLLLPFFYTPPWRPPCSRHNRGLLILFFFFDPAFARLLIWLLSGRTAEPAFRFFHVDRLFLFLSVFTFRFRKSPASCILHPSPCRQQNRPPRHRNPNLACQSPTPPSLPPIPPTILTKLLCCFGLPMIIVEDRCT